MVEKFLILLLIIHPSTLVLLKNKLKIKNLVCSVANDLIKSEEITTVAFLSDSNGNKDKIRREIHKCLQKDVIRFDMMMKKTPESFYFIERTLFVVLDNEIDWV